MQLSCEKAACQISPSYIGLREQESKGFSSTAMLLRFRSPEGTFRLEINPEDDFLTLRVMVSMPVGLKLPQIR